MHFLVGDLHVRLLILFPCFSGRSAKQKLGAEVFEQVYTYLKRARRENASEAEIRDRLEMMVPRASDCFEVDQLLYFEEQLRITVGKDSTF